MVPLSNCKVDFPYHSINFLMLTRYSSLLTSAATGLHSNSGNIKKFSLFLFQNVQNVIMSNFNESLYNNYKYLIFTI